MRSAIAAFSSCALGVHLDFAQARRELVEHAVHVFVAIGTAEDLRELDRLVDHDSVRHLELAKKLVAREKQYAALDRRKLDELPIEARCDHFFQVFCMID